MESVIKWLVWFVIMSLVLRWLARSRSRTRSGRDPKVLYHPTSVLVLGIVVGGIFLALAVLSYVFPNDTTGSLGISLFFAAFVLIGSYLILEYFRTRYWVEPGGLRYQTIFRKKRRLRWNEVARVHYSRAAAWFRIVKTDGETLRVSALLVGLPEFARAVLQEVDPAAIEATTRPVLEQTAAGFPPKLWM